MLYPPYSCARSFVILGLSPVGAYPSESASKNFRLFLSAFSGSQFKIGIPKALTRVACFRSGSSSSMAVPCMPCKGFESLLAEMSGVGVTLTLQYEPSLAPCRKLDYLMFFSASPP